MNKKDNEYSTQYFSEMMFLRGKGIRYDFAKTIDGLNTYKYKRTKELFLALAEYYSNN